MPKTTEREATEREIDQAIGQWHAYLKRKGETCPVIGRRGITGSKLVPDGDAPPFETRTVMFSLVEGIAPELGGLGDLTGGKRPHVYVEGIRGVGGFSDREGLNAGSVFFKELYGAEPSSCDKDPGKALPYSLRDRVDGDSRFLLRVYSANDLDRYGRLFENVDATDLVIFENPDSGAAALTLKGGWMRLKPFPYMNKKPAINPSTSGEIEIVRRSLMSATAKVS